VLKIKEAFEMLNFDYELIVRKYLIVRLCFGCYTMLLWERGNIRRAGSSSDIRNKCRNSLQACHWLHSSFLPLDAWHWSITLSAPTLQNNLPEISGCATISLVDILSYKTGCVSSASEPCLTHSTHTFPKVSSKLDLNNSPCCSQRVSHS